MRKTPLACLLLCLTPVLAVIALLVLRNPPPEVRLPSATPVQTPVILMNLVQPAPPEVALPVMQAVGWSLEDTHIRTAEHIDGGQVSYLSVLAVSSGALDTLPILSRTVDVLYAYLPAYNGVLRVPVPVGYRDGQQYYSLNGSDGLGLASREDVLRAVRSHLPRGQAFALTVTQVSYAGGVDRSDCTRHDLPSWCQLGAAFNADYPGVERLFLSRILNAQTWLPVGWQYAIFPAGTRHAVRVFLPDEG